MDFRSIPFSVSIFSAFRKKTKTENGEIPFPLKERENENEIQRKNGI